MSTSIFLARLIGVAYIIVGLGLMFNQKTYQKIMEDFGKNRILVLYGGMLSLIIGLLIVMVHNVWIMSWVVLITIFGWGGLIKGIWLICFPNTVDKFMEYYQKNESLLKIHAALALLIGLVLAGFGFFA